MSGTDCKLRSFLCSNNSLDYMKLYTSTVIIQKSYLAKASRSLENRSKKGGNREHAVAQRVSRFPGKEKIHSDDKVWAKVHKTDFNHHNVNLHTYVLHLCKKKTKKTACNIISFVIGNHQES